MKKFLAIFALAALVLAAFVFWKTNRNNSRTDISSDNEYIQTSEAHNLSNPDGSKSGREISLERNMKRLEAKVAMMGSGNAVSGSNSENAEDNERLRQEEEERQRMQDDPEAREAKVHEIYTETMQQFEQQEYDADWAGQAESGFKQDFTTIAANIGANLQNVECRTNACIAKMEFNNYEHAKDNIDELAARPYSVNCKRRVITPQPDDANAPYQVTFFFRECEKDEASL